MSGEPAAGHSDADQAPAQAPLGPEDFDALDAILDDMRSRCDETPQWEFCEGFMAALVCCRRDIALAEFLPVLFDVPDGADVHLGATAFFPGPQQMQQFTQLWHRRRDEIVAALDADIESLEDPRAYQPEILDVRGAVASLPAAERADLQDQPLPAFAQVWALGFMYALECWPEEWQPPRDRKQARLMNEALVALVALTEDDVEAPTVPVYAEDGPPSVSRQRIDALGDALWAVYDLRALWRGIGPRVPTLHSEPKPGRNDPCYCGSGKKYKKCHGAG